MIIKKQISFKVYFIEANCHFRYAQKDIIIYGKDNKIPCLINDSWCPLINVENGQIINWEIGKSAEIYAKICDEGHYKFLNENKEIISEIQDYVPKIMCPGGDGYGDYIIMNIDENGIIKDWNSFYQIEV